MTKKLTKKQLWDKICPVEGETKADLLMAGYEYGLREARRSEATIIKDRLSQEYWACWNCGELNHNDFFDCWKCHKHKQKPNFIITEVKEA